MRRRVNHIRKRRAELVRCTRLPVPSMSATDTPSLPPTTRWPTPVLVDALEDASPGGGKHDFQGTHHWRIMTGEILLDGAKYQGALYADMVKRDLGHLRRILQIMAESPGGRAILFPDQTADPKDKLPDRDPQFEAALDRRCASLGTTRTALLAEVKATVITPYEGRGESKQLQRDMVAPGHRIP